VKLDNVVGVTGGSNGDGLVSLADVAAMAGVTRPAVSNWRRRFDDFPQPVKETGATALFLFADVAAWMARHGKRMEARSADQTVWSVLNRNRGSAMPERDAHAAMILLGCLHIAAMLPDDSHARLDRALREGRDEHIWHAMVEIISRVDQIGLGGLFDPPVHRDQWHDSGGFLADVYALSHEFGACAVFEGLVAAVARGAKGGSEHATPASVADLAVALAAPIDGVVLDLAAGEGTMLLAAGKHARDRVTLLGQDINVEACRTARLRMLLHGLDARIIRADTLATDPDRVLADIVLADPPFGMSWRPERSPLSDRLAFGVPPASRADLVWIQQAIGMLRPDGRAVVVTPLATLHRSGIEGDIRRGLITSGCVRTVVALPAGLYQKTAIPLAILVLGRPDTARPKTVLLIDASDMGRRTRSRTELDPADIDAITTAIRASRFEATLPEPACPAHAVVSVDAILDDGANLVPASWIKRGSDPQQALARTRFAEKALRVAIASFPTAPFLPPPIAAGEGRATHRQSIAHLAELGLIIRVPTRRIEPDLDGTGDTPMIRAKDVRAGLNVEPGARVDTALLSQPPELTRAGDVLVILDGPNPRAGIDRTGGAAVSAPVQIVRPAATTLDPVVLAALIQTAARTDPIRAAIGRVDLGKLEIPLPDQTTGQILRDILIDLTERRRAAAATLRAVDDLAERLVEGLSFDSIRFASGAISDQADR
jgi:hypothetical protein